MPKLLLLLLLVTIAAAPLTVSAHGDPNKLRFVAPSGTDAGRCDNAAAPCRTLGYALRWVGKGGEIRVAKGTYAVSSAEEIFHLISGAIDVRGGFRTTDGFHATTGSGSTLIGVPSEYRSRLATRGFHIVADRKGLDHKIVAETQKLLTLHESLKSSMPATPCTNGAVNGLACMNVDLLSHVAFADVSANPSAGNDIWGFVDLNSGREYALVGYNIGTAVFDVTDPENPREVGFITGENTVWRDIKVYQRWNASNARWDAFAYVTADGVSDGLVVIDLRGLPQSIERIDYATDFGAAHNVYAANTDFGTGLSLTGAAPTLIIAGSDNGQGRFRSYSLVDPETPAFIAMPGSGPNDYMHDAASMTITDARKDTQCVNATSYCEVLFDFNESTVDLWDITDAASPVRLSQSQYLNVAYVHSGWWSEDRQYLFVHDELDEQNASLNTTLRVFSLGDLTNPAEAGSWEGPTTAIDHNGFVRGNRYYMSNYSRGLTVLDISDAANPVMVGHLDTYPASDDRNFVGAWGVYPFLHSGSIAISDIDTGFYVAADRTRDVPAGSLGFSAPAFGGAEGAVIGADVQRSGGTTGAVSVAYEIVRASADPADVTVTGGVLSWLDGDGGSRTISLGLAADAEAEGLEQLLIRLSAPTGGAALAADNVASVFISEPGTAATFAFATPTIDTAERGFATAVAVVRRLHSAVGAASVDYAITAGDADAGTDFQGAPNGMLNWADGDATPRWIEFAIADDGAGEGAEFFELTLSNAAGAVIGAPATLRVNISDGTGMNAAPMAVVGSSQTVSSGARVTLDGGQSSDPDGDPLTFAWTQTEGPNVALSNADTATATFTAPNVSANTVLRFQLSVSDPGGLSGVAVATVNVSRPPQAGGGSGALGLLLLGLLGFAVLPRFVLGRAPYASSLQRSR